MNLQRYQEEFTVKDYECDTHGRLMPGAFLRRVQQVGMDQCTALGLTGDVYARTHTAFLLAKQAAEFYAPAVPGQRVVLTTYPSPARRAVYNRYTELRAEDGTLLCAADSRWVLVDTETRRILRTAPEGFPEVFCVPCDKTLSLALKKGQAEPCKTLAAGYTRCDQNGHMNNTVYADIVCDAVPIEKMERCGTQRIAIVYHKEVLMGASFDLESVQTEENSWYVCGRSQQNLNFEAQITLNEES